MQYGPTLYTMPNDESMSNLSICESSNVAFMQVRVNPCAHTKRRASSFHQSLAKTIYSIVAKTPF